MPLTCSNTKHVMLPGSPGDHSIVSGGGGRPSPVSTDVPARATCASRSFVPNRRERLYFDGSRRRPATCVLNLQDRDPAIRAEARLAAGLALFHLDEEGMTAL